MIPKMAKTQKVNQKRELMGRRIRPFIAKLALGMFLACASLASLSSSRAEPVTNRVLSGTQIVVSPNCVLLKINFNFRVRYVSHFPVSSGNELRILIQPIDGARFDIESLSSREALRPPQIKSAGVKAIQYEARVAEGPTLSIIFDRTVNFDVGASPDFQSVVVSIGGSKRSKACKAEFPLHGAETWDPSISEGETLIVKRRQPPRETVVARREAASQTPIPEVAPTEIPGSSSTGGAIGGAKEDAIGALIAEARSAMRQNNLPQAISLLKKAVAQPENPRTPEARELLGVAYQKDKQTEAAKTVYEDYVRRYPNGEGSEGVRQRLLVMQTAGAPPSERLRAGPSGFAGSAEAQSEGGVQTAGGRSFWTVSGSVSQFFIRDDSYRVARDRTVALDLNATKEDHETHQNTLMSSFDLSALWGDGGTKSKFRFSGTEQHRFDGDEKDISSVGALYLETSVKDWGTMFSVGRQTRNTGGVLGRFDGAVVTYQWNPWFGVSAVGGSPVARRADLPFKDDKYFYGASLNFGHVFGGFDASFYAIEQRDREFIDRQAIGTELRYVDLTKSAFVTIDYDTHFEELDAAIFTGSWTMPDKSLVRLSADYRKAPYLTTWNALQGQPYLTLYELLKAHTQAEVKQMALDRTATYESVNLGYTRQLTDKLQLNLDFTAAHIDGTIASYGVDAVPDTGNEFYYSAQLVGNSLFTEGDLYTAAFRYSDLKESDNFAFDVSTRYPLTEELRIAPRLTAGYRMGKQASYDEFTVLPSLLVDYFWRKDLNLELEVGERWTWHNQGTTTINESELFVTAGFRYDFYADLKEKCATPSILCR